MRFRPLKAVNAPKADREAPIKAELVDLLFASTFNVVFIGFAAAFFCSLLMRSTGDVVYGLFAMLALVLAGLRFAIDRAYKYGRDRHTTAFWEMAHSIGSLAFGALVGVIGGYTFWQGAHEAELFSAVFLISYCTGIVTRLAVRPKLAIACVNIAALPYIAVLLAHPLMLYKMLAVFLLIMSFGSLQLIRTSYHLTFDALITRAELMALAGSDTLTGLANRFTVDRELQRLFMGRHIAPGHFAAVHFIDLDHFKAANDTHGHATGDLILVEVAQRLNELLPPGAIAARRGGDEFLIVQPRIESTFDAIRLARTVTARLSEPYVIANELIRIGASIGVAITDDPQETPQRLIEAADSALYEAKRKGRGGVEFTELQASQVA